MSRNILRILMSLDCGLCIDYIKSGAYPNDASDPQFLQAPRAAGESAKIGTFKVEVLPSDASGDTVRVSVEQDANVMVR